MLAIGCHLSSSKGYFAMGKEAVSIGGNTFQCFTRNPRGSAVKPLNLDDVAAYRDFAAANNLQPLLAHAPYTLNPCSARPDLREFAITVLAEDLSRLAHIPGSMYNLHPGGHGGQGAGMGIEQIATALNQVLEPRQSTIVLLETMVGRGSEIGGTFADLRDIINRVELSSHVGVCLDTCHVHAAGYDIVNNLDAVLEEFDDVVSLSRLKAVHLNDSMNPLGSGKDRHEKIGKGHIGLEAVSRIINHPALRDLPFYLETPNEIEGYKQEIALLRGLAGAESLPTLCNQTRDGRLERQLRSGVE